MKINLFIILILVPVLFSCSSGGESGLNERDRYEQTKKSLLEREQENPVMFLTATANRKKNLIGQTVVRGRISSTATLAIYKDIVLNLDFYSKTGALLESDIETIFTEVGPGRSEDFKTKYFAPKGADSVAVTVKGAGIVKQ